MIRTAPTAVIAQAAGQLHIPGQDFLSDSFNLWYFCMYLFLFFLHLSSMRSDSSRAKKKAKKKDSKKAKKKDSKKGKKKDSKKDKKSSKKHKKDKKSTGIPK